MANPASYSHQPADHFCTHHPMYIPPELTSRVEELGNRVGCELAIVRCWQSDGGRPVMYCNVRGILSRGSGLKIEIAGTVCAELTSDRDEVNLFLFVDGKRLGLHDQPFKYLIGYGQAPFAWGYNDEGFDQFETLDESTFSHPIDKSLVIPRPDSEHPPPGPGH